MECAGRAQRRRRFGFLKYFYDADPKRSRATLASALQNAFFSGLLGGADGVLRQALFPRHAYLNWDGYSRTKFFPVDGNISQRN